MIPYFVMPTLVLSILLCGWSGYRKMLWAVPAVLGLPILVQTHHPMWVYWVSMTAALALLMTVAWPGREAFSQRLEPDVPNLADLGRSMPSTSALKTAARS
jgi:hypothetical protein